MKKLIDAIKKALGMDKKSSESSQGFTLIELLVVIGIIGILAAAVLVAIDPLTKFKQSKDAGAKNGMAQAVTAYQTYYTLSGQTAAAPYYPYDVAEVSGTGKDLKVEPKGPDGTTSFTPGRPAACTAQGDSDCTEVSLYFTLQNSVKSGPDVHGAAGAVCTAAAPCDKWCWRSATNKTGPTATACTYN